jgi:hypothetical protein
MGQSMGRRVRLSFLGAGLLGACILAACAGGSNNSPNAPLPACALPTGVQITLVYPANGAVNVPDNTNQVVLAVSSPLPSTYQADLLETSTSVLNFGTLEVPPSPSPSPLATAGFANPVYQQFAFRNSTGSTFSLDSGTVYSVLLSNDTQDCSVFPTLGGFTSQ